MSTDSFPLDGKFPSIIFRSSIDRSSLSDSFYSEVVKESHTTIFSKFISNVRRSLNNANPFKSSNKRHYINELAEGAYVYILFILVKYESIFILRILNNHN